jgi:stage V sporulation protein R
MSMTEFSMKDLITWNEKIEEIAQKFGLNYYQQEFEVCDQDDMLAYMSYHGMPSHYPHWSFGKAFDKTKTMYKYNMTGLPYEMVINSNPCLAYLMVDNTLLLQILTIAHVYGHNDFFKNNRMFVEGTDASYTLENFKSHANRIRNYIDTYGYKKVEKILDSAHAIQYQVNRTIGEKTLTTRELKQNIRDRVNKKDPYSLIKPKTDFDFNRVLLECSLEQTIVEPQEDLMQFMINFSKLEDWEKDILNIVREETLYFIPQIETKIMNEGWASYWHYKILSELLGSSSEYQGLYIEFLKRHNQVIRPHAKSLNPYYIGFKIFEWIDNNLGREKMFEVREMERDSSFIRKYLNFELCKEMNLISYDHDRYTREDYSKDTFTVTELSDDDGWRKVRNMLASSVGCQKMPVITVDNIKSKSGGVGSLILSHRNEDGELELNYLVETLKHLIDLWGGTIEINATINNVNRIITMDRTKDWSIYPKL